MVATIGLVWKVHLLYFSYTTLMPKRTTPLPLMLPPREPGTPAIRWLCAAVRAAILEGRLRPGARLPATRDLARHYGLSRGTIVSAFEQLASEGYVEARVGSGTRVTALLPDRLLAVAHQPRPAMAAAVGAAGTPETAQPPAEPCPPRRLSDFGRRVHPFPGFRGLPARPAGAAPLPRDAGGAGRGAAPAAGGHEPVARLRADGIPAAAGSGGELPDSLAWRQMRPRAGRHRVRRAGGARPGGAAAAESRRPGGHREPGLRRRGAGVRGARRCRLPGATG